MSKKQFMDALKKHRDDSWQTIVSVDVGQDVHVSCSFGEVEKISSMLQNGGEYLAQNGTFDLNNLQLSQILSAIFSAEGKASSVYNQIIIRNMNSPYPDINSAIGDFNNLMAAS